MLTKPRYTTTSQHYPSLNSPTNSSEEAQLEARLGSVVNISAGVVDNIFPMSGSEVNISGGTINSFSPTISGNINLFGSDFFLDNVSLANILTPDTAFTINDRAGILTSVLADGSPFSIDLNSAPGNGFFAGLDSNATLTVTLVSPVPEPGSLTLLGLGSLTLLNRRKKTL